mmetsp:Transcript_5564/g.12263  ORF Transcript_5564/g.12263 Transcript_5564/m.12263 type:complete len:303 (-) Transcript_5564:19-927(-)
MPSSSEWWTLPLIATCLGILLLASFLVLYVRVRAGCSEPPFVLHPSGQIIGSLIDCRNASTRLFAWRLCVSLVELGVFLRFLLVSGRGSDFYFYTLWNFTLQLLFWVCAALAGLWHVCGRAPPRLLLRAVPALFKVCLPASILVTLVLWCILMPTNVARGYYGDFSFDSWNMHLVNTLLLLCELGLNRLTLPPEHIALLFGWASAYIVFVWVTQPLQGEWPYFFLKMRTPFAPMWYGVVVLLHVLAYAVCVGLSKLKMRRVVRLAEMAEGMDGGGMLGSEARGSDSACRGSPRDWLRQDAKC